MPVITQNPLVEEIKSQFLTEFETAACLSVNWRTLYRWRQAGTGPAHTRVGHKLLYRRTAIDTWLRERETVPANALLRA